MPFPETRWSVVVACSADEEENRRAEDALAWLCRTYWPPLYAFVRRRGHPPADAQDLVQGFFTHLLGSRAYARVDRRHGKFRAFLLASLRNFLADARDHAGRLKRGGGQTLLPLETATLADAEASLSAEAAATTGAVPDEERLFERRWALAVVGRALAELERECGDAGPARARVFRELRPFLSGGAVLPDPEEVAARLGMTPEVFRNTLSRLRARYRDVLRTDVARTLLPDDDVETELRYLCRVLLAAA